MKNPWPQIISEHKKCRPVPKWAYFCIVPCVRLKSLTLHIQFIFIAIPRKVIHGFLPHNSTQSCIYLLLFSYIPHIRDFRHTNPLAHFNHNNLLTQWLLTTITYTFLYIVKKLLSILNVNFYQTFCRRIWHHFSHLAFEYLICLSSLT